MASFKVAEDPLESMLSPGRSPARNRRRLSKSGIEKENADPKSPLSILKKGEQRRALGDLHVFDVRSPARLEMINGQSIEASPVFNKKKSKRSLSRRVSFAEKPAVRIFVKDTEYETPPDAKAQKTGLFSGAALEPAEPAAEPSVRMNMASEEQDQLSAPDFEFPLSAVANNSPAQIEILPAGNTGPILWGRSTEDLAEGNTEPVNWDGQMGNTAAQQTTPEMQHQGAGYAFQTTPHGTPGGNESSPEFFSPRNYVSPLSSDDGMELTHTPTADFELLPPQNVPFGSAISHRRRSSLGGGARPSFGGFGAAAITPPEEEPPSDPANFTDMTGSITAMVPKLAKLLAAQQDFTFTTGPVLQREDDRGEKGEMETADGSPVPSNMSLTVDSRLPPQQQRAPPEVGKGEFTLDEPVAEEGRGNKTKLPGRRFGDLLSNEGEGAAGGALPVFPDVGAGDERRSSITGAIPRLQDLLANDVGGEGGADQVTAGAWASGHRRGSITGAIPSLQALLEADQDGGGKLSAFDWAANDDADAAAQQEEEDAPTGEVFDFGAGDGEDEINSPEEGETTQLLNFEAFAKTLGADILAASDNEDQNVTAMVPRLSDLVAADGAEPQAEAPNSSSPVKSEQVTGTKQRGEPEEAPLPGIGKQSLPLIFTGDEQEEVFGLRPPRFSGGMRPSHGRASLQPSITGGFRPQHRRGSLRGRASVGGGWAAMLNEEAQEGEVVNRWWVRDKPSEEQEMKEPQDQAGGRKGEEEGKVDNQTSDDVLDSAVQPAIEMSGTRHLTPPQDPSSILVPPTVLPAPLDHSGPLEKTHVPPPSKKRQREESQSDPRAELTGDEQSVQSEASPQPAVKKQRRMQVLTPVTERSAAEESQRAVFGNGDQTGGQEVTQMHGEPAVQMEETQEEDRVAPQEEDRVAQEEIPTKHSGVFGGQAGTAEEEEEEASEVEYKMLRLEDTRATPAKSPSPNAVPISSRRQLRRSALKMQSALAAASEPPSDEDPEQQAEISPSATADPEHSADMQADSPPTAAEPAVAKEQVPIADEPLSLKQKELIPPAVPGPPPEKPAEVPLTVPAQPDKEQTQVTSSGPVETSCEKQPEAVLASLAESTAKSQAEMPTAPIEPSVEEASEGGPVQADEDVTETTLPLPPPRLQGLMHLRRESLGVLPPTQGLVEPAPFQIGAGKPFTPAAHRAFTPKGKENFTPSVGLSSVRKFRTPALDKTMSETAPLSVRVARNEDTTAEFAGEEDDTGKVRGRISFAEFLYKAEVRFLDVRNRASMYGQQTPTAEVAPPQSLAECLKVVCFHQPQATILDFGCGELRETIAAKKASVAHFEAKLQDTCPAIFQAVQTATGVERAALLKKLKDLKQRCRLEARRQWLEWRLKLEENTSERLQENQQNLMEDLAAVQQKRAQLAELRQDIRSFQAQLQADTQRAQAEIRAAEERGEETRSMKVKLAEELRRQQAEMERREGQAREAQQYREKMAARKEEAEAEQQKLLERLQRVEAKCAAARSALVSSGAAGDDGLGGGRIALDEAVMEELKQKRDDRKNDIVKELEAVAGTQGWNISKVGWQAPQTFPAESISVKSRLDLDSSSGTTDVSDSAATPEAAEKKKGPLPGDHLQGQDSGMVVKEGARVNESRETEGVIELRHHSGLFTHTLFSTGKEACPVESMLQIGSKAIDEAFPLIDGASLFAAVVLGRIGQRIDSAEGRPVGSVVQEASLRIGRLFDLLEELAECRRDFEALTTIGCTKAAGTGAALLHLRFVDHSHGVMFTLAFSLTPISSSTYPFGKLPVNLTVQYAKLASNRDVLERRIATAVSAVAPGFGRMRRTCRTVSELLDTLVPNF